MPRRRGISTSRDRTINRHRRSTTETTERLDSLIELQRRIFGSSYCIAREDITDNSVNRYSPGELNRECRYCGALHFIDEANQAGLFQSCCHYGKIQLSPLRSVHNGTPEIRGLFTGSDEISRNFRNNIRNYNSAMAFSSVKSKIVEFRNSGPQVYKIHGQIYHQVSQLHPDEESQRRYGQLYMIDTNEANNKRLTVQENYRCRRVVMQILSDTLEQVNPYANLYKTMALQEEEMRRRGDIIPDLRICFLKNRESDQRRYNLPTSNEIAGIFVGDNGGPPEYIDFVIYPLTGGRQFLKVTSPHIDPMSYPIFFNYGEQGWEENIPHVEENATARRKTTTLTQFYSHRIAIRQGFSILHSGGKLFQQYIVDAYVKVEINRLNYIRFNQKKLRSEHYQGIMDSVNSGNNLPVGRMVILPSSFIGSPRNMHQNYQDAMAIVRKFGKPDLFITFTCNPKWPEIVNNIERWQEVHSRPDLVSRVFQLKLNELIDDLTHKHILGKVVAYLYVIEFQKRGLPHAHILLSLRTEDKILTKDLVDKTVKAEIPDPNTHPELHLIVTKHLLHGPCGTDYPTAPCMINGVCSKGFPKPFCEETIENVDGYPKYRRRNNGIVYTKVFGTNSFQFDNRWVVPYNPYLLYKFDAHINTEVCASVKSVKYIYKYVYKGHDSAQVEINEMDASADEIKHFVDCRYVSSPEAVWRLFEYRLHKQSHHIIRLAVHLPLQQLLYFRENHERDAIENPKDTTLMAWFKLNQNDAAARQYLYTDIPYHYTFSGNTWKTRQRGEDLVISRMYFVSLIEQERYFLRILLLHVKGATSFEDIKTVDGVVCDTYREACQKRNLLNDENEIENTLEEAAAFAMPKQLRFLFATLCVFCPSANFNELWLKFYDQLTEDLRQSFDNQTAYRMALQDIKETLSLHNVNITDIGLPDPGAVLLENISRPDHEKEIGAQYYSSLNAEQKIIVDKVLDSVRKRQSGQFFIDGPGGTGKTHVYKTLIHMLRGEGETVVPVAWTGIAATLLPGGRTCHSRFKFPVPLLETSTSSIRHNTHDALVLQICSLIIWDEAPMAPKHALNTLDLLLKDLTQTSLPFGGKVVVLGGDFRQVLPVLPRASQAAIIECSIKHSILWPLFQQYELSTNMRARNDAHFSDWLLKVGNGTLPSLGSPTPDTIAIPSHLITQNLIDDIYGLQMNPQSAMNSTYSAILCPNNEDCFLINDVVLDRIDGEVFEYSSVDEIECEDPAERRNFPLEYINTITPSGMPPHKLKVKVGAIVMLLRNINSKRGVCNGTRLVVEKCLRHCIVTRILTGDSKGQVFIVPRISLAPSDVNLPFVLIRKQFPIRLSFAMTINKSQGQTFSKIGLYLRNPVFSHGQLYVAFSRVQSFDDIKVEIVSGEKQGIKLGIAFTSNIVCKQIL